jgi:hypothetical protein
MAPVVRFLFWNARGVDAGVLVRAVVPLYVLDGDWFGYYTGPAVMYLAGLELAVGRPPVRITPPLP